VSAQRQGEEPGEPGTTTGRELPSDGAPSTRSAAPRPTPERRARTDRHVLIDEAEDDWAWRRRIRSNPVTAKAYRAVVFVVGLVLVVGGLSLVPLPGPGWLIVILGLVVWSSEFEKAAALLDFVKRQLHRWNTWVRAQPLWVQGFFALLTAVFVLLVVYAALRWLTGVPTFLPDGPEAWLNDLVRPTP
jgi:uncharacterized protein (TIGR02611 family)